MKKIKVKCIDSCLHLDSMDKGDVGYIESYVTYHDKLCAVVVVGEDIKFSSIGSLVIIDSND